jgi:hypothetical protein
LAHFYFDRGAQSFELGVMDVEYDRVSAQDSILIIHDSFCVLRCARRSAHATSDRDGRSTAVDRCGRSDAHRALPAARAAFVCPHQDATEVPKLIETQLDSFTWFREVGLRELFDEISPIEDFTGKNLALSFLDYRFDEPRYDEFECRDRDLTYSAPLKVRARLLIKGTGEVKESEIFMGEFPLMTENGTFINNGSERVVVSQLIRSPGVYFKDERDPTTGRACIRQN